jgi:type II secretory pathway pseudopilin PulG
MRSPRQLLGSRSRHARNSDDGFTLLEAIVSFTIFAVVATSAVAAVMTGINVSNRTAMRVTATHVLQQDLESVRAMSPSSISTSGYPTTVSVDQNSYTINRTLSYPGGGTSCPSKRTAGTLYYINVTDSATWLDNKTQRTMRLDTVIAC